MLSSDEYTTLVKDLLQQEKMLEELGRVTINTLQGPYTLHEQALSETIPEQKTYNELFREACNKRKIIEHFNSIVNYSLVFHSNKET